MTPEQTRQLGIEFERRIQTMIPERELDKLDTETIYSFLNQYQDKYIHDIYRSLDQIPTGTKLSAHIEAVLQAMLREVTISADSTKGDAMDAATNITDPNGISISDTGRSVIYKLPQTFYMYVRSVSNVSTTYSFRSSNNSNTLPIRVLPNELVSQNDVWKLIETPHNSLRILRHPAAVLSQKKAFPISTQEPESPIGTQDDPLHQTSPVTEEFPTITVVYDQYTTPLGIKVLYYAEPQHFDPMTSTECELPMDVFEDLVSGAVDLYVQYAAGAEARKRQLDEANKRQAKNNQNDNED